MGFLGVYKAIYDYAPQAEGELAITEGELLYVLEKSEDDDWWKAKKKVEGEEEEEPEGLIPNNYIEEAQPESHARALYEYTRQTDEELSFPEDAKLAVYDTSDPDWILVGLDGEFGFVPANYIEVGEGGDEEEDEQPAAPAAPALPSRPTAAAVASPPLPPREPASPPSPAATGPAAALAGVLAGRSAARSSTPPPAALPPRPTYASDDAYDEEPRSPPLPTRPRANTYSPEPDSMPSPPLPQRTSTRDFDEDRPYPSPGLSPGGFRLYNINEMVSVMGKRKKMPTTLGVNLKTGVILIAPERSQDGPSQEWSADKMTHYSQEGKHVFVELVRPSKSVDFHAGAKDTAEEIVSALGELAGAVKAVGLKEVIMAGSGHEQKKGVVVYDFMAQGDDEVTVAIGDEVIVIDDLKSEEWWQVRRLKNGKEGVVPSSYIEITGTIQAQPSSRSGINAGKSTVEQNRLEEERLTKLAIKAAMKDDGKRNNERSSKRENGRAEGSSRSSGKSKPDAARVRTWTDRSGSFSVEAQFLGLKDGKLNLHKMNGVKIAVPVAKMSLEDLEYVERKTGVNLDEDKPLSDIKRRQRQKEAEPSRNAGATIEPNKKPSYDWFPFFLECGIAVGMCERYTQVFDRDSMDESVLPDIDASVLRTLGIKEGDIIKVMRYLDQKYGRTKGKSGGGDEEGGLFSGAGGSLRNNTGRGRPKPNASASQTVDAKAFSQQKDDEVDGKAAPAPAVTSPVTATSAGGGQTTTSGFDDDAWGIRPSKAESKPEPAPQPAPRPASAAPAPAPAPAPEPAKPPPVNLTGGIADLSLLTQPLQPEKATPLVVSNAPVLGQPAPAPAQAPQPTGATPGFFTSLAMSQQQTGAVNGTQPAMARQRPVAPQYTMGQAGLQPPPPARPLSAPQSAQPSQFTPPPLQPQVTGLVQGQVAPPGQSLAEMNQARMQQQYAQQMQMQQQQQPMMTGMMQQPMMTGMQQPGFAPNQFMPQPTGMGMMNGQPQPQMQSPFADPSRGQFSPVQAQATGFPAPFQPQQQQFAPQPGQPGSGFLPQPLEPQRTAMPAPQQPIQAQPTGHFTQGFGNHGMPPAAQPLVPQQTGPAPPVRFGVPDNKLMPQATGRRANLSAATPQNPFGF